eukprot:UN32936
MTHIQGRIFWSSDENNHSDLLLKLKSCERIFINCLYQTHNINNKTDANTFLYDEIQKIDWGLIIDSIAKKTKNNNESKDVDPSIMLKPISDKNIKFRVQGRVSGKLKKSFNHKQAVCCVESSLQKLNSGVIDSTAADVENVESSLQKLNSDVTDSTAVDVSENPRKKRKLSPSSKQHTNNIKFISDFKDPDITIFVHWNDERVIIGIPIGNTKRSYMPDPGIRSTLAWAIGYWSGLSKLVSSDKTLTVLDPCVGKGTLIVEAVMNYENVSVIGIDKDIANCRKI